MSQLKVENKNKDFDKVIESVSSIVHQISGNRLGEKQAYMVETRIKKRMIELEINEPFAYLNYIEKNFEKESKILVGLITTHHTYFFREYAHFEMIKKLLPDLVAQVRKRGEHKIKIWSAACSKGHEVYSIAMFLEYHLPQIDPGISYEILGTDIDEDSVTIALNGVYLQSDIKEIPLSYLSNNWSKGTGDISMFAKIKKNIKEKCQFKTGNLLNVDEIVGSKKFDIVFCRNVFIYFEMNQIEKITNKILGHLHENGILFTGISESITQLKLNIFSIGPSVYINKTDTEIIPVKVLPLALPPLLEICRVMCVDDSPSILTLLKKVISKEHGFEIVATAANGKEAMEKLKTCSIDIMTLDIHMPEMDGVAYLEKYFDKNHPPVIIISSSSMADSGLAIKALKLGASDFVEKPVLHNLEECGEEIRTKMRSLTRNDDKTKAFISSLEKEGPVKYTIVSPEKKKRVIIASLSDIARLKSFFINLDNCQPPTFIFFEGQGEMLEAITIEHSNDFFRKLVYFGGMEMKIETNVIYFVDFKKYFKSFTEKYFDNPTSILVYGNVSSHSAKLISEWRNVQLLLEDRGQKENKLSSLIEYSTDIVPVSSFPSLSCFYLSRK